MWQLWFLAGEDVGIQELVAAARVVAVVVTLVPPHIDKYLFLITEEPESKEAALHTRTAQAALRTACRIVATAHQGREDVSTSVGACIGVAIGLSRALPLLFLAAVGLTLLENLGGYNPFK